MGAGIPGFPGTLETKVFSALESLVFQGSRTPEILGAPESNESRGLGNQGSIKESWNRKDLEPRHSRGPEILEASETLESQVFQWS